MICNTNTIVLCKNKQSAKILFERYISLSEKVGDEFKTDRKHLSVAVSHFGTYNVIIRFVSHTDYYNFIRDGYNQCNLVGDHQFDNRLDAFEAGYEEEKNDG